MRCRTSSHPPTARFSRISVRFSCARGSIGLQETDASTSSVARQRVAVDSMDEHSAENGRTLVEKVVKPQEFRELVGDVQALPDTQRTALLLREIDGFAYFRTSRSRWTRPCRA